MYRWHMHVGSGGPLPGVAAFLIWRLRRSRSLRWVFLGALLAIVSVVGAIALQSRPPEVPIALPSAPLAVAADGGAHRLYVATADDRLWVLDTASQRLVGAVDLGSAPVADAANPTLGRVYVATVDGVTVLSGPGALVTSTIPLEAPATAIAADAMLNRVYVTTVAFDHGIGTGTLVTLDATRDVVAATIRVGVDPLGLAVDQRSHRVYVADAGSGNVVALGGEPLAVQDTIPVGGTPYRVAVDPEAGRVYVTDRDAPVVRVLDEASDTIRANVHVGKSPVGIAVDPVTGRVFVANSGEGTITALRGPSVATLVTLNVGSQPASLAMDAVGGRLYDVDVADRSVWLINEHRFSGPTMRLFARAVTPELPADEPGTRRGR